MSQHEVQDTVDLNALDIFDLSTFSSQATLNGGRAYVPLVGPIWRGVFGDVPVLGDLFSWKKNPRTVYHQSVLFASTIITPTAMQLALLYPIDNGQLGHRNEHSLLARSEDCCTTQDADQHLPLTVRGPLTT